MSSESTSSKAQSLGTTLAVIGAIGAGVLILALALYFQQFAGSLSHSQTAWGEFGDFIGGFSNPLLSFLALLAVLISLSVQLRELELTRREVMESNQALKNQNSAMEAQNFQTTFYRLLEFLRDLHIKAGTVNNKENPTGGFDQYFRVIINGITQPLDEVDGPAFGYEPDSFARYEMIVAYFVTSSITPDLGRYLRTLDMVANLIESDPGADSYRHVYFDILAAQLTRGELILMFFLAPNAQSGIHKIMPLIDYYGLFEGLGKDEILYTRPYLVQEYGPTAFASGVPDLASEWAQMHSGEG